MQKGNDARTEEDAESRADHQRKDSDKEPAKPDLTKMHRHRGPPQKPHKTDTTGGRLFMDGQNKIKIRDADFERGKIL